MTHNSKLQGSILRKEHLPGLWVGGLDRRATNAELRDAFATVVPNNQIAHALVVRDKKQKSLNYGFVYFKSYCARIVGMKMDGKGIDHNFIRVEHEERVKKHR